MTLLLTPRIWIGLLILAALSFGGFTLYRAGARSVQVKWEQDKLQQAKVLSDWKQRNDDLQRAAEKKYVVQKEAQDRYFVTTVKEIHDLAAPLASCAIPPDLRLRVNAAIECAGSDSSSTCFSASGVPETAAPAGDGVGK